MPVTAIRYAGAVRTGSLATTPNSVIGAPDAAYARFARTGSRLILVPQGYGFGTVLEGGVVEAVTATIRRRATASYVSNFKVRLMAGDTPISKQKDITSTWTTTATDEVVTFTGSDLLGVETALYTGTTFGLELDGGGGDGTGTLLIDSVGLTIQWSAGTLMDTGVLWNTNTGNSGGAPNGTVVTSTLAFNQEYGGYVGYAGAKFTNLAAALAGVSSFTGIELHTVSRSTIAGVREDPVIEPVFTQTWKMGLALTTTLQTRIYGGPVDKWGYPNFSVAQLLSNNLNVGVQWWRSAATSVSIDAMGIKVYYLNSKTKNFYVKHNGIWKPVDTNYVRQNGVWKDGQQWVKHNGIWKKVYGA